MTRLGRLSDTTAGIEAAEAAGFHNLKLDTVLIGGFNDDEIEDFVNLTREHPWEVRFIELMPMGPCAEWDKGCFLPDDTVLQKIPALQQIEPCGVARRYRLPCCRHRGTHLPGPSRLLRPVPPHPGDGRWKIKRLPSLGGGAAAAGLHGPELKDAIRQGILHKPERHHLAERRSDTPRNMNQIGG